MLNEYHDGKMAKWRKDGAQRKREHDARKREAGLKEFRAWVTPDEARQLRETLARIRETDAC